MYEAVGRFAEGLVALQSARMTFTEHGKHADAAHCDFGLGRIYSYTGRDAEAAAAFSAARLAYAELDLPVDVADCDLRLGVIHSRAGHYATALRVVRSAQMVYAADEGTVGVAECDLELGNIYSKMGEQTRAFRRILSARKVFAAHDLPRPVAHCDHSLGVVAGNARRYEYSAWVTGRAPHGVHGPRRSGGRGVPRLQRRTHGRQWVQGRLDEGLALVVPTVLYNDALRTQFPTGSQRWAWAERHVRAGLSVALRMAADLGGRPTGG